MGGTYCQINEAYQLISELQSSIKPKSWSKFYSYRIRKFFEDYLSSDVHKNRDLRAITENEVNNFIESLPYKHNEKANYYRALKKFFEFTSKKGATQPFFIKVKKIEQIRGNLDYITKEHVDKILRLINGTGDIDDRLILAIFLYTGLGRKYISNLTYGQISDDMSCFRLDGVEYEIPIKDELRDLLYQYKITHKMNRAQRLFDISESGITNKLKEVSKRICGRSYNPTIYSNTFIVKALGEEDPWANIYVVGRLTVESLSTIAKHITSKPAWIIDEQRKILRKWK